MNSKKNNITTKDNIPQKKIKVETITPTQPIYKRFLLVMAGALVFALNLNTMVHSANLFPGGFAGLSLLIQRAVFKFTSFQIPYSVLYLTLNAFPVYISFRYIGKKFTFFSLLMILLSSILSDVLPEYTLTEESILCAVFGGLLNGTAISLCLFADATSGGTDFIAIFFSEKYGKDMWNYIFAGNCCVLFIAGILFGWDRALYSIVFQYTSTQVLNYIYRKYQKHTIFIVTKKPDQLYKIIRDTTNHGCTRFEGQGCYEQQQETILYAVVSGEQTHKLIRLLKDEDPAAFINVIRTKEIMGAFYRRKKD